MKKYYLSVECVVTMNIEVEATCEQEAIEFVSEMSFSDMTESASYVDYDTSFDINDVYVCSNDYDTCADIANIYVRGLSYNNVA